MSNLATSPAPTRTFSIVSIVPRGPVRSIVFGVAGLMVGVALSWAALRPDGPVPATPQPSIIPVTQSPTRRSQLSDGQVQLARSQQEAIDLETEASLGGVLNEAIRAPGQVEPDETQYAFINPRAAGVVHSVAANVDQEVAAGDLLATINSPDVAQAKLELVVAIQNLEVARTQAEWQEQLYGATRDLLSMLEAGLSPEQIEKNLADRAVGRDFGRLMTAYSKFLLARSAHDRRAALRADDAVSLETHQQAQAEYQAARASFEAMMDGVAYQAKRDHTVAFQGLEQAVTATRVARERLRVLGVPPDSREDDTISRDEDPALQSGKSASEPIGLYPIRAPFDGTILDRELVVPGVAVDPTHRIFTVADLSSVYVRVKVHESEFGTQVDQDEGRLRFTSPAYPDEVFEGRVLYAGDLVDEKTRAIQLLARADNPDRQLKPGMFVEAKVISPQSTPVVYVPPSAILSDGEDQIVFVRTDAEHFRRRVVRTGTGDDTRVPVLEGLEAGEPVVVQGAFKLKAVFEATDQAGTGPTSLASLAMRP